MPATTGDNALRYGQRFRVESQLWINLKGNTPLKLLCMPSEKVNCPLPPFGNYQGVRRQDIQTNTFTALGSTFARPQQHSVG